MRRILLMAFVASTKQDNYAAIGFSLKLINLNQELCGILGKDFLAVGEISPGIPLSVGSLEF